MSRDWIVFRSQFVFKYRLLWFHAWKFSCQIIASKHTNLVSFKVMTNYISSKNINLCPRRIQLILTYFTCKVCAMGHGTNFLEHVRESWICSDCLGLHDRVLYRVQVKHLSAETMVDVNHSKSPLFRPPTD